MKNVGYFSALILPKHKVLHFIRFCCFLVFWFQPSTYFRCQTRQYYYAKCHTLPIHPHKKLTQKPPGRVSCFGWKEFCGGGSSWPKATNGFSWPERQERARARKPVRGRESSGNKLRVKSVSQFRTWKLSSDHSCSGSQWLLKLVSCSTAARFSIERQKQ